MSFGGGKLKPEDLFSSLKTIQDEFRRTEPQANFSQKFFERFRNKFTEEVTFDD